MHRELACVEQMLDEDVGLRDVVMYAGTVGPAARRHEERVVALGAVGDGSG
jgi:hypothetical protein